MITFVKIEFMAGLLYWITLDCEGVSNEMLKDVCKERLNRIISYQYIAIIVNKIKIIIDVNYCTL